jgi:tetratricopeptide (TPR) repeat protein
LRPNDRLFLTTIQNKTGDKTLDGTVMQGLEFELRQSESLNLFASGAYPAGLRQLRLESGDTEQPSAQNVAAKVGATAYLYGEITGTKAPYTISIDVLKTKSNDKLTNLQETAASREEIPAAIGRLAQALREEVQGDGEAGARTTVPLGRQATANVDALHEYAVGEEAMASGRAGDALTAYQHAAALDPMFPQAQMRLAWLYRKQRAEIAAASAAGLAKTAASHADDKVKLLAQFCYEINGSGDYGRALETIQKYVARYPRDVEGMKGLALVLGLRGRWAEALLAAQQGNNESAYDAGTYTAVERALIGADRYDDALQLAGQAERLGVLSSESVLAAAYLGGKDAVVEKLASSIQPAVAAQGMDTRLTSYGLSLDNSGNLTIGTELWTAAATQAAKVPEFASTQASMLAQGALDRALAESCSDALKMANAVKSMERGPEASFKAGMAAALCGDKTYAERSIEELRKDFPQNSAVIQYYVQDLEAAAELGVNEPARALEVLMSMGQYDEVSLTPYLRGLAHAATGQAGAAVSDFQNVLAHRGSAFLLGSNVYPMAEFGLARAFATSGNKDDSVTAYRRFLKLWSAADSGNHLTVEATAKSR